MEGEKEKHYEIAIEIREPSTYDALVLALVKNGFAKTARVIIREYASTLQAKKSGGSKESARIESPAIMAVKMAG